MRVLILGGGGREHALAWKLREEGHDIFAAPGNPGIAQELRNDGHCVRTFNINNHRTVTDFVRGRGIDFTIVGPEAPLQAGIVDYFRERGLPIFGPTKAAARIETSKTFCCKLLAQCGVPIPHTNYFTSFTHMKNTLGWVDQPAQIVLKKSGLAAGKDAEVVRTPAELAPAVARLEKLAGDDTFITQHMVEGPEMSCFYLTDGSDFLFLGSAQDYKPLSPGGPMTGGMGGFSPHYLLTPELRATIEETIVRPTIEAMADADCPYTGVMYFQLMITEGGPVVIEINCRFGDPEAQLLMPLLDCPLLPRLMACTSPGQLRDLEVRFKPGVTVGINLTSEGYPDDPKVGRVISDDQSLRILHPGSDCIVFQAGTEMKGGQLVTQGGRVITIVGVGPNYQLAKDEAMTAAGFINFEGKYYRHDIANEAIAYQAAR